jgi:RPA family protein
VITRIPIIITTIFILAASNINADCNYPKKNFVVPAGSKATEAEMIKVMGKVKTYQADLGSYRTCLEDELKQISPDLEAFADIETMMTAKFNASVEDEEMLAEDWSAAVKAFKSQ